MNVVVKYACEHCGREFPKGSEAERHEWCCNIDIDDRTVSPRVKGVLKYIDSQLNIQMVSIDEHFIYLKLPCDFAMTICISEIESQPMGFNEYVARNIVDMIKKSFIDFVLVKQSKSKYE